MSDSDNEENPDMIELTLNYENKRADEEIDDDFNDGDLEKFCEKNFGIDINKYDIQFYYHDKKSNQKTPLIPDCISSFYDPYKFNKGNNDRLMLYVETKLKEVKEEERDNESRSNDREENDRNNEDMLYSNVSNTSNDVILSNSGNFSKKEEDIKLYEGIKKVKPETLNNAKTEETKEPSNQLKSKLSMNSSKLSGISNISGGSKSKEEKKLEEAKNKYTKICTDIDGLNKEKDELEKESKKIKELIEQENKPDDEDDDDDDEKELNEYESKKENLEKRIKEMESEKLKEIEDLKEENLKLENMIADLSLKLSKQKEENQNLKKENENLQKNINELNQDQINSSSLSFNSNELSLSNANFFSDKNEIQNYMGNNENKIKQKEKKKERLTKINELYQKMKNDNTKFKLRKKDTSELGLRSSNSLSLSRVNSRISGEIKNNKKVENIQLKKDITVLEEKINSIKNDIENLKTKHENQVKNIKNTQI